MLIYIKLEPNYFEVGYIDPVTGQFNGIEGHKTREDARRAVHFLNGGAA